MAKSKAKILVCEDNVALSGVICFNLVRAGFEVTSVGNGRLALDACEKGSFDLVLSDQQMPMMTGIQLCENLRELPAHTAGDVLDGDRVFTRGDRVGWATNADT